MPVPPAGGPHIPDAAEVRRALSAVRHDQPLGASPLIHLDAVWELLLRDGVAPTARGRDWGLSQLLHEAAAERLDAVRRAAGVAVAAETTCADRLAADFAAGSPELEAWSALYHRYLDAARPQVGEIVAWAGMPRRSFGRRLAAGQRMLARALAARERAAARHLAQRSDLPLVDPVAIAGAARSDAGHPPGDALLRAARGNGARRVALAAEDLDRLATTVPRDLAEYRLGRVAAWSRPAYRVDARFVGLTLLVDRGEDAPERWHADGEAYDDLAAVLRAVPAPAVVLLGPPGSGKSTLLRRLELDLAEAGLRGETEMVPFFASLGAYAEDSPGRGALAPGRWLAGLWERRYSDLPSFTRLLDERRLVLLLDGLNEMPHQGFDDYRARILAWKRFLRETVADHPGVRVVFSCRSLDYGAPLSSPEQRVPQVRVEPMTDAQIRAFLQRYAPRHAEGIWSGLRGTSQLALARSPYWLALLAEHATAPGEAPVGRAALFTGFVRRAIQREIERDNPLFQPGALLDERDYRRATSARPWVTPWALPERGALVPGLTSLAHGMQARFVAGRASQVGVGVGFDAALDLIGHPAAEDVVHGGAALGVLDEHRGHDEVLFAHQLQQEYFAARRLAADPRAAAARVRIEVRADAAVPALATVLAEIETTEPLPPLPTTGWEEIVLLAASMSDEPAGFVDAIAAVNPTLAGRAAAQMEVAHRLGAPAAAALRDRLLAFGADLGVDVRARIEAGEALGLLGDPRFAPGVGPDGAFLMPPMVTIPAGTYVLGADGDPSGAAGPRHVVRLAAFELGRFPVTNAEWSRFMASGGYDDPRWWDTPDAESWRRGDLTAEGSRRWVREWVAKMRLDPGLIEQYVAQGLSREQEAMWRARLAMGEAELCDHVERKFPRRRYTDPYSASQAVHAGPGQPVSGISWYEARAFCGWLSAQSGLAFRLPSEAEWEAAARGGDGRPFPWGDRFDATACNTAERHLRRAAPIGVMPDGRAPCGAEMLIGDVWEWTASLWGPQPERCAFGYPYDAADGRERPDAPASVRRIQRGGSFAESAAQCTASVRNGLPPDTRFHGFGMRLARSLPGG